MQKMSQEFAQQGLNNAGAMRRQMVASGGQMGENQTARNEQRRAAKDEKRALHKQQIAYLGELIDEQSMLAASAAQSGDPEQLRRLPELQKNVMRLKNIQKQGLAYETLAGILERNKDSESLEATTAAARGGLVARKGQEKKSDSQQKPKEEKPKEEKKQEGTTPLASSRKTIQL